MNIYIITGASKGIGKALAEQLLETKNNQVVGVSRNCTITHPRYRHQPMDLSDLAALEHNLQKVFQPYPEAEKLVLVNNAAVLGDIGYIGEQRTENFEFVFDVNVISPGILMNTFLSLYATRSCPKIILNISSGAGKYPVDGWANYCASKSALDMLSLTAQKEQEIRQTNTRIFSLSPGVVDTAMQEHIREADPVRFSSVQKFVDYKKNGDLASAEKVAAKIARLLQKPEAVEKVLLSITEI
ncbi:SDR family NAD(P)-dependent oxidoreductase [soil metagenome]